MAGEVDKAKGKIKKAAGELTGNQRLKDEGRVDESVGKIKEVISRSADKVKRALR